jgi:sugar transferase (PEP-CTERM/EpsH1 system associated)
VSGNLVASSSAAPERLRILTVAARPFYPANTGGRIRSSEIFERLSRLHHVTILCFRTAEDLPEHVERMRACCAELEVVEWRETRKFTPRFYGELAASLASPLPYTVRKYRSAGMRRRIRARLATSTYDLLLCDFLQPAVNCIGDGFAPKVLFQHNVEAVIQARHARHAGNRLARAYLRIEAAKLARFERRASRAFDRCIMVSDEDCRTMQARYGAVNAVSIPTGVDADYFHAAADVPEPEIVFVGSMDWLPNQDAVDYFVGEILPRIRRVVPATFTIVGRDPPAAVQRHAANPHIRVTGTVPDVRPFVARAQVVVVPLRVGGGTRIKIFEAMAMKKAVVSTSVGAEGLPVVDRQDVLLADDPSAFADRVVELLREPDLRRRIAAAGRDLVSSRFTWDAVTRRFSDICVQTVDTARARRPRERIRRPASSTPRG